MYEEEANMIGFLACIHSSDVTFQYSGYLSVLNYINNEFYDAHACCHNHKYRFLHIPLRLLKQWYIRPYTARLWHSLHLDSFLSDKLSETSMVWNGVEDGILSYTRVVGLLLQNP